MTDSKVQAILLQLGGGATTPSPVPATAPEPAHPQMIFFPISGATSPLKQN
jgi:hypothetical protein